MSAGKALLSGISEADKKFLPSYSSFKKALGASNTYQNRKKLRDMMGGLTPQQYIESAKQIRAGAERDRAWRRRGARADDTEGLRPAGTPTFTDPYMRKGTRRAGESVSAYLDRMQSEADTRRTAAEDARGEADRARKAAAAVERDAKIARARAAGLRSSSVSVHTGEDLAKLLKRIGADSSEAAQRRVLGGEAARRAGDAFFGYFEGESKTQRDNRIMQQLVSYGLPPGIDFSKVTVKRGENNELQGFTYDGKDYDVTFENGRFYKKGEAPKEKAAGTTATTTTATTGGGVTNVDPTDMLAELNRKYPNANFTAADVAHNPDGSIKSVRGSTVAQTNNVWGFPDGAPKNAGQPVKTPVATDPENPHGYTPKQLAAVKAAGLDPKGDTKYSFGLGDTKGTITSIYSGSGEGKTTVKSLTNGTWGDPPAAVTRPPTGGTRPPTGGTTFTAGQGDWVRWGEGDDAGIGRVIANQYVKQKGGVLYDSQTGLRVSKIGKGKDAYYVRHSYDPNNAEATIVDKDQFDLYTGQEGITGLMDQITYAPLPGVAEPTLIDFATGKPPVTAGEGEGEGETPGWNFQGEWASPQELMGMSPEVFTAYMDRLSKLIEVGAIKNPYATAPEVTEAKEFDINTATPAEIQAEVDRIKAVNAYERLTSNEEQPFTTGNPMMDRLAQGFWGDDWVAQLGKRMFGGGTAEPTTPATTGPSPTQGTVVPPGSTAPGSQAAYTADYPQQTLSGGYTSTDQNAWQKNDAFDPQYRAPTAETQSYLPMHRPQGGM